MKNNEIFEMICERLLREATGTRPTLYFLVGPPAVGKSTWIRDNLPPDAVVANRDEIVARVARETGIGSYDDMFTKPPRELTPPGMPSREVLSGPEGPAAAAEYAAQLPPIAARFNSDPANRASVARFGRLKPITADDLIRAITVWRIPLEQMVPFHHAKVGSANDSVGKRLDSLRSGAARDKKSIVVDMTNMSKSERDGHRAFLVGAIEGTPKGQKPDPTRVGEHYRQVAIVFAPEGGYNPELREKIKRVAAERAAEAKARGEAKTIPAAAYDRMFANYEVPSREEGFDEVRFVGVPSLTGQGTP